MLFERPVRLTGFPWGVIPQTEEGQLDRAAKTCKALAVAMVGRANSGHPGGAVSSMKMYMAAYGASNITPENCDSLDRDFVVISHGHTSAAAYATLAYYGFVDPFDVVNEFRKTGSSFQGHVERMVPGIDWGSGCLGQGLSAAAGFALAQRARHYDGRVYVLMGDGDGAAQAYLEHTRHATRDPGLMQVAAALADNRIPEAEALLRAHLKRLPTDDDAFGPGSIRADGRKIHPAYLFQVKPPEESRQVGDIYKLVSTIGAEEAFRPIADGGCPITRS